jgi:hypothetical protein
MDGGERRPAGRGHSRPPRGILRPDLGPAGKETRIKAKATLHITGDRYGPTGRALIDIEKRAEGFFFAWKAQDSEGTEIAESSKTILFSVLDNPAKPHPFLEQYIRTNIQMTQLKRKNKLKVVEWSWLEK